MEPKKDIKQCFNPVAWGISECAQELLRAGTFLENERIKLGLSISELSKKSGVSETQLLKIEKMECVPSFAAIYKIAAAIDKKVTITIK